MTRWEVLCRYQNPDLAPVDKALLYRFIGEEVRTSIRRSKYCRVHYEDYALPSPELIGRLAPNDYTVEAYYLPDEQGNVPEVYITSTGPISPPAAVSKPITRPRPSRRSGTVKPTPSRRNTTRSSTP